MDEMMKRIKSGSGLKPASERRVSTLNTVNIEYSSTDSRIVLFYISFTCGINH